uniref:Uncharacterized protein n=1 Tax=Craspedostauros australis TaxID=1486917 RepID=A0A7R9ZQ90_9STRA|mmetsp:Transcript_4281/g.11201  ORF Transcript_4281/g.11201 Transcript_4281/m.11201 type:complete len:127 (+) Transcript_4281:212-592(+)
MTTATATIGVPTHAETVDVSFSRKFRVQIVVDCLSLVACVRHQRACFSEQFDHHCEHQAQASTKHMDININIDGNGTWCKVNARSNQCDKLRHSQLLEFILAQFCFVRNAFKSNQLNLLHARSCSC